jgi:hypothetical protein
VLYTDVSKFGGRNRACPCLGAHAAVWRTGRFQRRPESKSHKRLRSAWKDMLARSAWELSPSSARTAANQDTAVAEDSGRNNGAGEQAAEPVSHRNRWNAVLPARRIPFALTARPARGPRPRRGRSGRRCGGESKNRVLIPMSLDSGNIDVIFT